MCLKVVYTTYYTCPKAAEHIDCDIEITNCGEPKDQKELDKMSKDEFRNSFCKEEDMEMVKKPIKYAPGSECPKCIDVCYKNRNISLRYANKLPGSKGVTEARRRGYSW